MRYFHLYDPELIRCVQESAKLHIQIMLEKLNMPKALLPHQRATIIHAMKVEKNFQFGPFGIYASLGSLGAAARINHFSSLGVYGKLGSPGGYPSHWRKRKRLKNIIDKILRKRRKTLARMRSGT